MKTRIKNYKEYPFPTAVFVSYIILSSIGFLTLFFLGLFLNKRLIEKVGNKADLILNGILYFFIMIAVFVVLKIVLSLILDKLCGRTIYRGIGLYRFLTAIALLCPLIFVAIIVNLNVNHISHTFFSTVSLLIELAFPFLLTFTVRGYVERCPGCGLINTFRCISVQKQDLGVHNLYHNEGGYSYNSSGSGRITASDGSHLDVSTNRRVYVPKTMVSDGLYQINRHTSTHVCNACKYTKTYTYNSKSRIM